MGDKKDGKGFFVKCLLCHESKTKYNRQGNVELLSITNNSGYNAKRHIKVSKVVLFIRFNFENILTFLYFKLSVKTSYTGYRIQHCLEQQKR